jgi:hypothetical protein
MGYTDFRDHKDHKKTGQDLAQPPPIAWRDKQMYVEQTPVPGSGSHANSGMRTPDATGKGATPGYWCSLCRIPVAPANGGPQLKKAP